MTWIFTIVFSGLLLSSNQSAGTNQQGPIAPAAAVNDTFTVKIDETDRFEQTYPLSANGRVSVSNVNGSITAEAWDRNEVKLIAVKTADTRERLNEAEIKIDAKADSFLVETSYDNWGKNSGWRHDGKLVIDYQLMVPRGAVLGDVDTVNGSVTVSNFTNVTKVSAVNGTIKATNLRGTAELSTVNGEVLADFSSLDAGSKISLETVNGKVNLMIPSDANATIKAESVNGSIVNDFGLPVRKGKYVGRDLYGKLGSGDVRIKLESVNGELKFSHPNDGRSMSPATNLLQQKEKDEEEWDSDADAGAGKAKTAISRRDAARVQQDVKRALNDAQREIARAEPEIERATAESLRVAASVINSEDVKNAIKAGLKQNAAVLARISDASFFPTAPRVERKSNSFAVAGVPNVKVESHGCAVKVTGWDKSEVKYSVTQLSPMRDNSPIDVQESRDSSGVTLTVKADDDIQRTRIEIFVPRKTNLIIKTDGEIRLDGVSGNVDLTGQDGVINVRDVDGKLTIASSDGRIRVIGFKGEINTKTADGTTLLEGDFTKVIARSGSGGIVVTLPDGAAANLRSESAETKVEGLASRVVSESNSIRELTIGSGGPSIDLATTGEVLVRSAGSLSQIM
jgi:DUF4097 and DUF4098 domain-containing protein YvlB